MAVCHIRKLSIICVLLVSVCGCARTPAGIAPLVIREMTVRASFVGPINDSYYYFFPIDTVGGGIGPVPVFPGISGYQGWVTGSADYYIQYHQRQYTLNRITNLQPFESAPFGSPVRSTPPSIGGNTLVFTVDLDAISANNQSVDLNIIAVDQPLSDTRLLDALGLRGTDFLNIEITNDRTFTNSDMNTESINDILDRNSIIQPSNDQTKPLDISDWSITIGV